MSARSRKNQFWPLVSAAATLGIAAGFAVPLAASYQPQKVYQPVPAQLAASVVVIPTITPDPPTALPDRDSKLNRLAIRNRRLEAMIATLHMRMAAKQATR